MACVAEMEVLTNAHFSDDCVEVCGGDGEFVLRAFSLYLAVGRYSPSHFSEQDLITARVVSPLLSSLLFLDRQGKGGHRRQ